MNLRTAIPAGLIDIGTTALSSFLVQAYAVRTFDADVLGVYALFFSAYLLASLTPQFLFLYPLEISSLQFPRPQRISLLSRSIQLVGAAPIVAAVMATITFLLARGEVDTSIILRLALTSAAVSVTAPFYDHLKRMMHLSEQSGLAALTALLQLLLVVASVAGMAWVGVDPALIPLGSLAMAQGVAAAIGIGVIQYQQVAAVDLHLSWLQLIRSGRWLLIAGLVPAGATFVAAATVSRLAGVDKLGFAQAAHVAARPVLILATGLAAVLGFRMMEAGAARSRERGSRFWRLYSLVVAGGAIVYAALVGFDWVGNPLAAILPRAYEVGGLVAVTIVANVVAALIKPPRDELIGARFEPRVASIDSTAALAIVIIALLAEPLQAFAIPLGVLGFSLIQVAAYLPARRALYGGGLSSPVEPGTEVAS